MQRQLKSLHFVRAHVMMGLIVLGLTGCAETVQNMRDGNEVLAETQIRVEPSVSSVSIKLTEKGGLSHTDLNQLNAMLRHQGRINQQTLILQPLTQEGQAFASKLEQVLVSAGANPYKITQAEWQPTTASEAWDLQIRSEALIVITPDCRIADSKTWTVDPYGGIGPLGCASRANLARMVADPRDLSRARQLDSADGVISAAAVERYQEDELKELIDIDFAE